MTKIKKYVHQINEELDGAKKYAEKYIEYKSEKPEWSKIYYQMSNDELKHADALHTMVVQEIEKLKETITPPQSMIDKWERAHGEYIENAAWVKQMLAM